jgi:hypothetical protein
MLCERKKPYLSIGGTFSSFSTSDINDDNRSDGVTFYQEFLKEGLFQSAEIVHTLIREEENGKPIKPFAVITVAEHRSTPFQCTHVTLITPSSDATHASTRYIRSSANAPP